MVDWFEKRGFNFWRAILLQHKNGLYPIFTLIFYGNVGKHTIYWVFVYRSLPRKKRKIFPICLFSFRFSEPGHHTCLAQAKCLTLRSTPWVLTKCLCNLTRGIHSITIVGGWTTHFKNMLVKLDHFLKDRGENSKNDWNHHLESRIWLTAMATIGRNGNCQMSRFLPHTKLDSKKSPTGPIEQYLTVLAIYEQGSVGKVLFNF